MLDGDTLVLVPRPDADAATPIPNTASGALADRPLAAEGPTRLVLAAGPSVSAAWRRAFDEWRALTAAWLVGLSRSALELGTRYAVERKQFGVPIGSFQAIGHQLADAATALDGAALLAAKAIWALDEAEESRRGSRRPRSVRR